jgi:hypothetical protein
MSKLNRWKDLERRTADHFDKLIKKLANKYSIDTTSYENDRGKIITRNVRGDDFSKSDSDVDIILPDSLRNLLGSSFIIENKYRKSNPVIKMFYDFRKTRPSSFLTPIMLISTKGGHYLMRGLNDFLHLDWMHERDWSDIWIHSTKLSKNNNYVQQWMKQAETYIEDKALLYGIDSKTITPLVVCSSYRTQPVVIQKIHDKTNIIPEEISDGS